MKRTPNTFSTFLLERQHDSEMAAAATKSFDVYLSAIKETLDIIGDAWVDVLDPKSDKYPDHQSILYYHGGYPEADLPKNSVKDWPGETSTDQAAERRGPLMSTLLGLTEIVLRNNTGVMEVSRPPVMNAIGWTIQNVKSIDGLLVIPEFIKDQLKNFKNIYQEYTNADLSIVMTAEKGINMAGSYQTPKHMKATAKEADPRLMRSLGTAYSPKINLPNCQFLEFNTIADVILDAMNSDRSRAKITKAIDLWKSRMIEWVNVRKSTYVHEYTHFLDDIRYKNDNPAPGNIAQGIKAFSGEDKTLELYFKSDAEWNAHFMDDYPFLVGAFKTACTALMTSLALANSTMPANGGSNVMPQIVASKGKNYYQIEKNEIPLYAKQLANYIPMVLSQTMKSTIRTELRQTIAPLIGMLSVKPEHQKNIEGLKRVEALVNQYKETKTLFAFCLLAMAKYRWNHVSILMSDPKFEKKLVDRIFQMSLDIQKIITDMMNNVRNGKLPTTSDIAKAQKRITLRSPKPNPKIGPRTKSWDTTIEQENYLWMLYSGAMNDRMSSPISFTKPFPVP